MKLITNNGEQSIISKQTLFINHNKSSLLETPTMSCAYWLKVVVMILQQLNFPKTISNTHVHETVWERNVLLGSGTVSVTTCFLLSFM